MSFHLISGICEFFLILVMNNNCIRRSTKANDLHYYERVTRESGPAMTWGMHSIGHLRIGNSEEAGRLFTKSYQGYVREPFKVNNLLESQLLPTFL